MRKIKKIVSIFMITVVAFTVAVSNTSVSADDVQKPGDTDTGSYASAAGTNAKVTITKEIVAGQGVSLDAATTFNFKAELKEVTTGSLPSSDYDAVDELTTSINFATGDNGTGLVKESADIFASLNSTSYPHAGVYVYTVTETTTSASGYVLGIETYTMYVYVYNKEATSGYDGTYIHAVTVAVGNLGASDLEDSGIENKKVDPTPTENGTGNAFRFKSYYNEQAGLSVDKTVSAGSINLDTETFAFTISFALPTSVTSAPSSTGFSLADIKYEVYTTGTTPTGTTINVPSSGTLNFNLKHNQEILFTNLPAGTTYTITETVPSNYTATAEVTEQGTVYDDNGTDVQISTGQAQIKRNGSSTFDGTLLVGENSGANYTNSVSYLNTYTEVSITGLIIDNLPFIALMGVGVVGLVYIALNKKRKSI